MTTTAIIIHFMYKEQPRSWIQLGQMRKNPAMTSRVEALNPETPDYKTSALTSPLLCLLKVISNRKLNIMVMLTGRIVHLFGSQFYFYLSYVDIDLNFYYSLNAEGFAPYKETRCTDSSIWWSVCYTAWAWNVPRFKRKGWSILSFC